jgi:hypothetical protein
MNNIRTYLYFISIAILIIWEQIQKGTLDIIHTKRLKLLKLSNEASCLTPTTKNSKKIQVEGERLLSCGVSWERALLHFLYMIEVDLVEKN